jgi:hypothetical protein
MSYEEMAESMGVSKGTIMSRLFHARQKMQKALADVYAELDGAGPPSDAAPAEEPVRPRRQERASAPDHQKEER